MQRRARTRGITAAILSASWPLGTAAQGPPDLAWVGKGGFASRLAMSPDGQSFVVSTLLEYRLKMWRTDGTYVRTFGDDGGSPHWCMAYSPDGEYIVAGREALVGSGQATALIYRSSDGALVRGLNPGPQHDFGFVHGVDYSPGGNLVAVAYNEYISGIELYEPLSGVLVRSLPEGGYGARFSRDGLTLAGTRQGGARLWRVADGAVLHTFPVNGGLFSFSRDGQVLAIGQNGSSETSVRLFRTSDGALLRTIVPATVQIVQSIEFSPAQDLLVISGYRDGGRPQPPLSDSAIDAYHLDGTLAWSYFHLYGIAFQVGFTPDGQTLMVAGGWVTPPIYVEGGTDSIQRLDPATGAELAHFATNRGYSSRVAFSPDGALFVSGGFVMQVWNALEGTVAHTFDHGAGSVEFSRDGTKMLANVGNILVYGIPGYAILHVLAGHNNGTTDAVFAPDGTMVASGGFDNRVKLRRLDGSIVWNNPVNSPPETLAASPDGQIIAAGTRGSTIYLWRTSDGALLRTIVGVNAVQRVAFSPDSTMLAAAESNYFENLKLYRVFDGALLRSFVDPTYGFQYNDVAFTPDGSMLVFSSGGQYLEFRRIADGSLLRLYTEETGTGPYAALPVAVSPDGRFFGYGRADSMVMMARNPFAPAACYANCDGSTQPPALNVLDFNCFLNRFSAGDPYANCDGSTTPPVLNVLDFACFLARFAEGCP